IVLRPAGGLHDARRDARTRGALEGAGRGPVTDDQLHARSTRLAGAVEVVHERLEIRPAARGEDGDARPHASPPPNCGTRKGFDTRSCPTVVAGPWPGYSTVSSGRLRTCSRIERMSSWKSPPGRSVRPMEPANTTSPTNAMP